ncbi:MAG TPA: 4Fe-4S dicluster domain-containing protein [Kiritimatiellia bacterium]|nr:4Fe-4S dicluster domain-containing protein [Kiritimatiellia bacterium]HRZ12739.1 4Fe-4S dicluster domain-containing protein [Kiritimatiellia bacterium]HSA18309.1 4Fe-4S dicluster domain-containing protein [Kiritimatiellia bacterium]
MLKIIEARIQQKQRTRPFPPADPRLSDRYQGRPVVDFSRCARDCGRCVAVCPTGAIRKDAAGRMALDLGRCLFCGECAAACPADAIRFTGAYSMSARRKEDLVFGGPWEGKAEALAAQVRRLFGRSLKLRQVSAGGCNACEADTNVLNTPFFDLGRFGIQFVASPRHADGLLITGPVPANMRTGLLKTWEAIPAPKLVIAVGACAISGGPYADHAEVQNGAAGLVPVDLFIPGCPPHPFTILDGLVRLLGRIR